MSWLFQSIPKRYNLATGMKAGDKETWLVTRYMNEIKNGDLVFLWMAGTPDVRGLYGWGQISDDGPKYYKDWGYGVEVRYEKKFSQHIPFSEVRNLQSFDDYVLFKTAIGTNFKLSDVQTESLIKLIERKYGPEATP